MFLFSIFSFTRVWLTVNLWLNARWIRSSYSCNRYNSYLSSFRCFYKIAFFYALTSSKNLKHDFLPLWQLKYNRSLSIYSLTSGKSWRSLFMNWIEDFRFFISLSWSFFSKFSNNNYLVFSPQFMSQDLLFIHESHFSIIACYLPFVLRRCIFDRKVYLHTTSLWLFILNS